MQSEAHINTQKSLSPTSSVLPPSLCRACVCFTQSAVRRWLNQHTLELQQRQQRQLQGKQLQQRQQQQRWRWQVCKLPVQKREQQRQYRHRRAQLQQVGCMFGWRVPQVRQTCVGCHDAPMYHHSPPIHAPTLKKPPSPKTNTQTGLSPCTSPPTKQLSPPTRAVSATCPQSQWVAGQLGP